MKITYIELPFYLRNPLTKLQISNYSLRIETGRFNLPPLPINQHKCFSCEDTIEDEHFLFNCDWYQDLDDCKDMIYYFQSLNLNFNTLPDDDKWILYLI